MYLNKLEIYGFKSFANKTLFTFSPGITALVGPNGCGKTNVVDAIRWVLGEQKTSILRSDNMENVIFNGTGNRKQLGMSEVSLVLENTKGILPVEYSEVTVTRRLFRDGDSNYLINNTQCRLKDIIDLFMDTGMGANSYSVIELKMVEAILSGKPEERRHLLEEAAGINKYKLRRKETARKLTYVQNDMMRVRDIVVEVEKNVNSLARQASKTRRYKKLNLEQISLEKQLIAFDFKTTNEDMSKSNLAYKEASEEKTRIYQEITDLENFLSGLEKRFYAADEEWVKAVENETQINARLAELNQDFAVSIERINAFQNNIDRLNRETELAQNQFSEFNERIDETNASEKTTIDQIRDYETKLSEHLKRQAEVYDIVADNRKKLNSTNERIILFENQILSIHESKEKSDSRKTFLLNKINESNNEISGIETEKEKVLNDSAGLNEQKISLETELSVLNDKFAKYKSLKEEISKQIEDKKQELANTRVSIAKENSAFEFLSKIVIADDASKFLLDEKRWLNGRKKPMLIELIDADENLRPAVQSALGNYANVFVVDDSREIEEAVALLKNENKGKAYFIARDSVPDAAAQDFVKADGIIGYLSELVNADNNVRNILRLLIGDVAVSENYEMAARYVKSGTNRRAVTYSGEIIDYTGLVRGGSVSGKEGVSVGKYQRIDRITKNLAELNSKHEEDETILEKLQKEYLQYNIESVQSEIKKKETDLYYIENTISQKSYQIESLEHKKNNVLANISAFEAEQSGLSYDNEASEARIGKIENSVSEQKSLIIEINKELVSTEQKHKEITEQVKSLELDITRLNTELNGIRRDRARIENQIKANNYKIESYHSEIEMSSQEMQSLKAHISTLDTDKLSFSNQVAEAQTAREILQQSKSEIEQQIKQYEEDLTIKRKNLESLTDKVHQIDIAINELKSKLVTIHERNFLLESEKIEIEKYEMPEEFNPQLTKTAIQELKNKLTALGMINFMALEDYEKETERLNFYQKQVKDLMDSEKILQDTINEINQTAEQMFNTTFENVRNHFTLLFKKLFTQEGEADIKLTGENVLECDIEIVAKPPGKKPHSIEMLSGGEKTLTSIAFLFAIYLVKPSPFCILDEVDAPLDDANIDKFIDMIREFSANTQFLVVTHNKRTMESADTMYGITQQEEGISKIVSVKFQE